MLTFFQEALVGGLAVLENRLDKNAHVSFWRIPATDNRKPETLFARAFFKRDSVQGALGAAKKTG